MYKPAIKSNTKRTPIGKLVSFTAKNIKKVQAKYPHYYIVVTGSGKSKQFFYQFLTVTKV